MVMMSNNTGRTVRALATRYRGRVGHLISPGGERRVPGDYALDNGAFAGWDENSFLRLQAWASAQERAPLWTAVPDVVGDREATLGLWHEWAPRITGPRALVVQDGMSVRDALDVTPSPDLIFVGGSVAWKWRTVPDWSRAFPRVHVGRVNSPERLWRLYDLGVVSCDGTGWMRGDRRQLCGLVQFLRRNRPDRFRIMFGAERREVGP